MRNKLFIKDGCPYCEAAKAFLDEHAPVYVEYNVSVDDDALRLLATLVSRTEVPVLISGYMAVVGFEPTRWSKAIAHGREIDAFDPYHLPEVVGRDPHDDE